jgi:hypothetical protein
MKVLKGIRDWLGRVKDLGRRLPLHDSESMHSKIDANFSGMIGDFTKQDFPTV